MLAFPIVPHTISLPFLENFSESLTLSFLDKDSDTKALEGDLSAALGMRVSVDHKMGTEAGSITISYKTLDQLDDLCALLSATNLDGSK